MKRIPTLLLLLFTTLVFAQDIVLEPYASGFDDPVELKNAGDDRLFVVEQGGTIQIIDGSGTTLPTPFLDISGLIACCGERGLLGLAFHPDYATNGFFYVNYTFTAGGDLFTRISRFSVDPGDPNIALPGSELEILTFEQPYTNHNGGCVAFGADGFLYISAGDGGSGGDPENRAQNTEVLLGKLLRIDVDNPVGTVNYGIPADNPFAGDPSQAQEIWAYGLRNSWKFSFDSATDDLWIADVGQNATEEINRADGDEAGLNYGWNCFEGSDPFPNAPVTCPPPMAGLTFPVAEYPHSVGFSITGGYVYNGTLQPSLAGYYFFGDFGSGLIGTIDSANNFNNLGTFGGNWSAFGVNNDNELFIVNYSGAISRITEEVVAGVDENSANNVTLYPNPAKDKVSLQLTNDMLTSYEVLDMKGSALLTETNISAASLDINIASLSQGMYLLKGTTDNNKTFVKKLVVK